MGSDDHPPKRTELNDAVHAWGGVVLHDVIDDRFARKAVAKGADGLIGCFVSEAAPLCT